MLQEFLEIKKTAEQPSRALGDDDHVRLSRTLQTRRKVRRLANDTALVRLARPDQVADHNQASCNAHTGLQRNLRVEPGYCGYEFQPCPHGALRVVLVGFRIAEVHQHAVTHVLGNKPVKTVYNLSHAFLIGRNDLAKVLRVHAGGKRLSSRPCPKT